MNSHHRPAYCFISALLFFAFTVKADNQPGGDDIEHPVQADLVVYDGLIIDSIEIENRKIYDTEQKPYNNFFFRTANKLHVKTKRSVIARELLCEVGGEFSSELAEETTRNLRSRYVIYDAWNEVTLMSDSSVLWKIVTIDEWSFAGGFEVSREGNEYLYLLGFDEKNFLGFNQSLSLDYYIQQKDDNYIETSFRDYRILGYPFSFSVVYRDNPKSKIKLLSFRRPFYNLLQRNSFGIELADASTYKEIFDNSRLIGSSISIADLFNANFSHRFGERERNLVGTLTYNYNFEKAESKHIFSSAADDSTLAAASFPVDSLYHRIDLSIRIFKVNFATFRKIDGFGYTEDFTLGHTAAIGFGRAFNPQFDDHVYDRFAVDYSFGHNFGNEIFYASVFRANKFKGGREHQKITGLLFNFYHNGPHFLTIAFRSKYLGSWELSGAQNLILGGATGIRGYPREFKTGEKLAVTGLEFRVNPGIRPLSSFLGLAAFVDAGRTWNRGEVFNFKDYYFSGGLGLRFALDRSSKSRLFRVDMAYSENTKWQLSITTGQYFGYTEHRLFLTSH